MKSKIYFANRWQEVFKQCFFLALTKVLTEYEINVRMEAAIGS